MKKTYLVILLLLFACSKGKLVEQDDKYSIYIKTHKYYEKPSMYNDYWVYKVTAIRHSKEVKLSYTETIYHLPSFENFRNLKEKAIKGVKERYVSWKTRQVEMNKIEKFLLEGKK